MNPVAGTVHMGLNRNEWNSRRNFMGIKGFDREGIEYGLIKLGYRIVNAIPNSGSDIANDYNALKTAYSG